MLTLPRLVADPPLEGSRIRGLSIAPDARWLMFLRGSEADSAMLDLWGMPLTAAGAAPRLLVRASDIVGQQDEALSEEERMARERKRIRLRGLVSYSYCGEDGHDLLLTLHGDLYHVVPKAPAPEITRLTADGGPKLDVRGSPHGTMASYVKDNEVYATWVKTSTTRQLTQGATATLHHGVAEFVAQEEMGRFDGHWWSKDERYLAYTEVDVSPVSIKRRPRMHADRADLMEQRYPATGEANARISVRVLDLQTSTDVKLATPAEDGYIPRVDWFGDHQLYVQWQSRDQRLLVLCSAEPPRFRLTKVMEETDETWVESHHDLRVLRDGTVLWPSERSGMRQLYRVAQDGLRTALTRSPDPVTHVVAVDEDRGLLFYERATNRARERQLFSVPLAGGTETQLTHGPGIHSVAGHRAGKAFIESVSDLKTPWRTRILDGNATLLRELEPSVDAPWHQLRLPQTE